MGVLKEWYCAAHGDFDAPDPLCPRGCKGDMMVQRAFRTPVGIQSTSFRNINGTLQSLADEHGLSDMHNRGGDGMRKFDWQAQKRMEEGMDQLGYGRTSGKPLAEVFRPTSQAQFGEVADGGLHKTADGGMAVTLNGAQIPIVTPRPRLEAPAFDGRSAGLPTGD